MERVLVVLELARGAALWDNQDPSVFDVEELGFYFDGGESTFYPERLSPEEQSLLKELDMHFAKICGIEQFMNDRAY